MSTQCPNCGKRMDSSWRYCPYCAREEQGKKKDAAPAASPVEQPMTNDRQHTRVASNVSSSSAERKTEMFSNPAPEQRAPRGVADNRKIVGVLVSYTWNPYGTRCGISTRATGSREKSCASSTTSSVLALGTSWT